MYTYGIMLHPSLAPIIAGFEDLSLITVHRLIATALYKYPDAQRYAAFETEMTEGERLEGWTILTREELERKFDFNPDMIDKNITRLVYKDR